MTTNNQDELQNMANYHAEAADRYLLDYCHGQPDIGTYEPTDTDALLRIIAAATTSIALTLITKTHA